MSELGLSAEILGPGIALGRAHWIKKGSAQIDQARSPAEECLRLQKAILHLEQKIEQKKAELEQAGRREEAQIFEAYAMMVADPELLAMSEALLKDSPTPLTAEAASGEILQQFAQLLNQSDSTYMRERSQDIAQVQILLQQSLNGQNLFEEASFSEDTILLGEDITAVDLGTANKNFLQGVLTAKGGPTSHTAIVARSLELPALQDPSLLARTISDTDFLILDGNQGKIFVNPDAQTLSYYRHRKAELLAQKEELLLYKGKASVSGQGVKLGIEANIGSLQDAQRALEQDAEGVGLFRSELSFLEKNRLLSEEEQFALYHGVLTLLAPRPVTIRVLDLGADKELSGLGLEKESNPFLGVRGLRLLLQKPELFRTQLRALYRASKVGNLSIMLPMVTEVSEILASKKIIEEVCLELGIENKVALGVMIEVPAAALCAEDFAPHVDFFSLGTNDLTQYTLAADRLHPALSHFHHRLHPSVAKLIELTVQAAQSYQRPVSVCGELANEAANLPLLLKLGVNKISVGPARVLALRKALAQC